MATVKLVFACLLSLTQILTPYFQFVFNGGIKNFFEDWSVNDVYTEDYAVEIAKDPNKDFVVLNFSDIQLNPQNVYSELGNRSYEMIKKTVSEVKPDLITLTGDNCSSDVGYLEIIKLFDSFGIPWAPVMGNHDGDNGNRIHEGWDAYQLSHAENCLFKFGPKDMGYGNYIINVTENGKIIHTLFMLDTHSSASDTEAGKINFNGDKSGYDHLWANQIEWYKWAVNGIKTIAGKTVESTAFMHIPVYEYRTARDLMCYTTTAADGDTEYVLKPEYADGNFGTLREGICSPEGNNGFFDVCLDLGSTKTMVAGHDHVNDLCLNYKGIALAYSLKGGYGSYWDEDRIGGSVLTVNSDGAATFSHHYANLPA